ncbi:MAG: LVIVD repeat-containing protein, partial [Nitrospinota bacterium]
SIQRSSELATWCRTVTKTRGPLRPSFRRTSAISARCLAPAPNAFVWMVDVTDETNPVPVSTWRVPHEAPFESNRERFGAHQPQEQMYGEDVLAVTWFAGGVRFLDISDPYRMEEVGFYVPFPGKGYDVVQSNDVFVDRSGLIYVVDRFNGFEILERTA